MANIKVTPHYAAEQARVAHTIQRRFDDLKTLIFALVICSPIATVVGMVIGDWFMIGLALAISCSCGLTSLYLLRKLETMILPR